MLKRSVSPLFLLAALAGCGQAEDADIAVSVIGGPARAADPNTQVLDAPAAVMTGALMQGLVQFDAQGQIEPALAERWIVTDDGLSYIFRLRRAKWSDGGEVTAAQVANSLRTSLSLQSRNALKPMFGPVTEILAMTDTVLEIRLSEPLGNLLQLLAQPEMALLRKGRGTGPYRIYRPLPHSIVLRPVLPDTGEDIDEDALQRMERRVRGEDAPMAVARFAAGEADLVLGGTFNSYPLAQASGVNPRQIRRDPVPGLLGLVPARADGPIADRDVRRALAMAINRTAFVQHYAITGWGATEAMLPAPIGTFIQAVPDWAALDRPARLDRARRLIGTSGITLRVALPDGPGGRLLFAQLAADWRQIGVRARRVGRNEAADLRLIDAVAPIPVATWYVSRFRCPGLPLCSQMATNTLSIMRRAKPEERPRLIAEADQSLADDQLYIPIAVPLRWSLVAPRLLGYADNGVAIHPLNRLEQAGN